MLGTALRRVAAALAPAALLTLLPTTASAGTSALRSNLVAAPAPLAVGVQLHSLWSGNTQADVDRQLDMTKDLGSTTARVDIAWSSLQDKGRGIVASWYRDRIDYLVAGASARGIGLILNLNETPCWASSAPETLKLACTGEYWNRGVTRYPPTDVADFAWAANWLAARYGTRVAAIELWNEPNYNSGSYTTLNTPDRPAVYTAMVKAAYPAVKAAAPGLPVLAGAMSFADVPFLQALYANGIRGSYDGISVHPYNEWRAPGTPWDPRYAKYDLVLGMQAVRDAMLAAGDTSPVWITELGWTTCVPGSSRWCVTEAQQAEYLAASVPIVAAWPWVRSLVLYNLRNKGTDVAYSEHNFGIVHKDYTRKPAYESVKAAFTAHAAAATGSTTTTTTTVRKPKRWTTSASRLGVTLVPARRLTR